MNKVKKNMIRVIVFMDGDQWVAQCLEHDICAQAADLEELRSRIGATIEAEAEYSKRNGKKPFEGIEPAPKHYHEMWERRSDFSSASAGETDAGPSVELALCA
jgi:hypothetical protein